MSDIVINTDESGYLQDPADWNAEVAQLLAARRDTGRLTGDHLAVLEQIRHQFLELHQIPVMRHICEQADLPDHCVSDLLSDPLNAWIIAGLPDPGEEAKAYLESAEIER